MSEDSERVVLGVLMVVLLVVGLALAMPDVVSLGPVRVYGSLFYLGVLGVVGLGVGVWWVRRRGT